VRLRVISWIESLSTAGDPLNHTKNHEKQNRFLSLTELATLLACCTVIFETLHQKLLDLLKMRSDISHCRYRLHAINLPTDAKAILCG
jgi:hypothetical protein